VGGQVQAAELFQRQQGVRGQEQRSAGGGPRRTGIQRRQGHREQRRAVDDDRDAVLAGALPQVGVHRAERGQMRRGQGRTGAQAPASGALPQGNKPGHVTGQEAPQPRHEGGLTIAEQGDIARAAQGERPLRRAVTARHQHRHQQRLGQPAPPVAPGRREQRVSRRKSGENEGRTTGHTAPPDCAASLTRRPAGGSWLRCLRLRPGTLVVVI
jgi:hypothetical protein